jgi:tetraacyldisaccharide 4'-kinase
VIRGYGGDEPLVHSRLNPGVPVVVDPDRVRGIRKAADDGADSVVLDDGFQHRRAARNLDFVLVSADDWSPSIRLLPAGPYRESPESLERASAVLITAKAASPDAVEKVGEWIAHVAPGKPVAVLSLVQYDLVRADLSGETRPVSALAGKRIVAVAALGNPSAFFRQLEAAGATVIPIRFADHHLFTTEDAARAARLSRGADFVVCTLKDAVKLAPLWPATASPLWYVSLSVEVARGETALDEMLRRLPGRRG